MNVRALRLQGDYESMRSLVRSHPQVKVESVTGNPPERYKLALNVRSLRQTGGQLEYINEHEVEIRLPLGYPRDAPYCRMLTPIFHPNIAPHAICIGDHWSAGESLDALVMRICEMIAYQSYNVKSPLNGQASRWVVENINQLPLDQTPFVVLDEPEPFESAPLQAATCGNCGQAVGAAAHACRQQHLLCDDCFMECQQCGRVLCLVCNELTCSDHEDAGLNPE